MAKQVKTIGILTSGGDAPGMNAAIRAVVRRAINDGLSVKGIQRGYMGLLNEEIIDMDKHSVSDIIQRGAERFSGRRAVRSSKRRRDRRRLLRYAGNMTSTVSLSSAATVRIAAHRRWRGMESIRLGFRERSISTLRARIIPLVLTRP